MHGKLSTHVLDIAAGKPAFGMAITLWQWEEKMEKRTLVVKVLTNADGRTAAPLLAGETMRPGLYELVFEVAAYFNLVKEEAFLDSVPIRFRIVDSAAHYHVPLLVSPWAYSTYRGS